MKDDTPSVSVIVPVYNVERYLTQCLESLVAQDIEKIEFVCIDDGSTDSSPEILRSFSDRDDRFRIIRKPNGGYGAAINRGIDEARGEYLGIVESDDFVERDMFSRLLSHALDDDLDVVRANYWLYWSGPVEREELADWCREELCGRVFSPREMIEPFFFPPALWSMLVRRELVASNRIRLLETPGASFQDTSFSFKIWALARRAKLLHEGVLHYRQDNEASSINSKCKAYYVCDEYAELERFASEKASDSVLMNLVQKRKYDAYTWNLERIDPSLRLEFARRAKEEFGRALEIGWMNQEMLSRSQQKALRVLLKSPELFVDRLNKGASPGYPVILSRLKGRIGG